MSYYVYGLMDPTYLPSLEGTTLAERLGSVFYVGKGVGFRSEQHVKDAMWLLENAPESVSVAGDKISHIINLHRSGKKVEAIKLMAGFEDEKDAYRAEAFAIEAVNAFRVSLGRPPLTNAVKGHGVAIESFDNFAHRMQTEFMTLSMDAEYESILVKGSVLDLWSSENTFELAENRDEAKLFGVASHRIMVSVSEGESTVRRGWDIQTPWTDAQARERARRYWPIAKDKVQRWINNPESAPRFLFLGISDSEGTAVRYVWEIDAEGCWEYYPESNRWGIPLGKAVTDHPYLDKILVDGDTGKQVLASYSSGIRIDRF